MATPPIAERTAQLVSHAMVKAGVNRSELAERVGLSRSTLTRKLAGTTARLDVTDLYLIAKVLGVPPSDLLPEELREPLAKAG